MSLQEANPTDCVEDEVLHYVLRPCKHNIIHIPTRSSTLSRTRTHDEVTSPYLDAERAWAKAEGEGSSSSPRYTQSCKSIDWRRRERDELVESGRVDLLITIENTYVMNSGAAIRHLQ